MFKRCWARREPRDTDLLMDTYWGRCDLTRGHDGPHELERGMILVSWSTEAI